MILITGATGGLGGAVIKHLREKDSQVQLAALIRDETKAEQFKDLNVDVRIGNFDDYDSLIKSFRGIDKLYMISGSDIEKRTAQHKNIVKAAEESGVKLVVYTSFARKPEVKNSALAPVEKGHLAAEDALKNSGLDYTILKHNLYMEVVPMFLGQNVLETGVYIPAGEGKANYALREDLAEAAANILLSEGHENKEYLFSGAEPLGFKQIADILSELSGKELGYTSPDADEYHKTLSAAGVPEQAIQMTVVFSKGIEEGQFDSAQSDLERILGRKPASLKDFLKQVYNL